MINWDCSDEDNNLIDEIVQRYCREVSPVDVISTTMDITACHCNGNPLDLGKLLGFPLGSFGHDVGGIIRYMDRRTGKLTDNFAPRCSK